MKGDYMRKKFLGLVTLLLATSLVACGANGGNSQESKPAGDNSTSSQVAPAKRYTVKFMNGDERVATESVKEGESLTAAQIHTVNAPEGYLFEGWSLTANGEVVDLTTYVVNADVTLYAVFKEAQDTGLSVDDVKEEGKTYYLVLGWWEVNDPADPTKVTSHLTKTTVRLFYQNLINYLKASGATDENIANIQFRNYATATVAQMGEKINADGDVDIMIGVGNNINSSAGCTLYNSSNDYKFQTPMGDGTPRYVACLSSASELGVSTYTWLRDTTAGVASFVRELTAAEITESLKPVDLAFTVKVHGDELKTTVLHTKSDVVEMPTITIPEDKNFVGFALTADGEVVLEKAKDATLKYDDLVSLVAEGVKTIDLYPVFEAKPVVLDDLVVYVQLGSSLKEGEAKLLEARFNATLTTEKVKFNYISGDAATFSGAIGNDSDIIIGGNNPVNNLGKHADGPTANVGAKHFISANRKIIISDKVSAGHLDLAKAFYAFATAAAPEFAVHATFWPKTDNSWLTADEVTNFTGAITTNLKTFLDLGETDTLEDKYNVKVLTDSVTTNTTNGKDKVADLGAATLALRDGKGSDLVIGCGGNVDTASGLTVLEKRAITVTATGRYAALLTENCLTRSVFDGLFPAAE
jgi:hypothetical protein